MTYFRKVFFKKPPKLIQKEVNGKRFYYDPLGKVLGKGVLLPSVTTITGALSEVGIGFWKRSVGEAVANKVQSRSLVNGTEMHSIIEDYLNNKFEGIKGDIIPSKYKNPVSKALFTQAKEELGRINNIKAQEVQLYSMNLGVAGRVDCIAEFDGTLSVIDFKSAKKKKQKSYLKGYMCQATCYALMYEELTKEPIEQIVILVSAEDGTVQSFIDEKSNWVETLMDVIEDQKYRREMEDVFS